eukprot:330466_1
MINLLEESVRAAVKDTMTEVEEKNTVEKNTSEEDERISSFFNDNPQFTTLHNEIKKENTKHPLYDLKNRKHEAWINDIYNSIMKSTLVDLKNEASILQSLNNLTKFEYECFFQENDSRKGGAVQYGLIFYLGIHIARSRLCVLFLTATGVKNIQLSIIVPMYKEDKRMQIDNEDFIRRKVNQLNILFKDISREFMSWDLLFVDDGCPNQSAIKAKEFVDNNKDFFQNCNCSNRVNVAFLKDGIESKDSNIAFDKFKKDGFELTNTNDSRKGGAVQYGFYLSLLKYKNISDSHYIMFTDADLSTNISQSGLFLYKLITEKSKGKHMIIGDRYLNTGISSGGETMGDTIRFGLIFHVRHIFRRELLQPCRNFYDTQCGFKLMSHASLNKILYKIESYKSMFDQELLLTMEDEFNNSILMEGIVWLHSVEESNFAMGDDDGKEDETKISVKYAYGYYKQLQEIINIHITRYKNSNKFNKEWVEWIKKLSWKNYYHLCQCLFSRIDKLGNGDITQYYPTIQQLNDIIAKEELPKDVDKFVENPDK